MSSPTIDQIVRSKTKVCAITDIPIGEGREVTVGSGANSRIAVFRSRNGSVYATQATCPHRQGPLADGILSDSKITCPMHELLFDLKSGEALDGLCDGLKTYEVELDSEGEVWLSLTS